MHVSTFQLISKTDVNNNGGIVPGLGGGYNSCLCGFLPSPFLREEKGNT